MQVIYLQGEEGCLSVCLQHQGHDTITLLRFIFPIFIYKKNIKLINITVVTICCIFVVVRFVCMYL